MSYIGAQPFTAEFYYDVYSGNGSNTAFVTTINPGTPASVIATVNGVVLDPQDYFFDGNKIIFNTAPPSGTRNVQLRYLAAPASGVAAPSTYRQVNEYTAANNQTVFNVSRYDLGYIDVYVNGVQLGTSDYQASDGQTIVLQVPARNQDFVRVISAYNTVLTSNVDPTARAIANAAATTANSTAAVQSSSSALAQTIFDTANNALSQANFDKVFTQAAFNQANTNAGLIGIIQAVNDSQNTNITGVNTYAQSVYNKANSANVLAQAAFDSANTKLSLSGGTLNGPVTISNKNDLTVTGNLFVQGTTTTVNTDQFTITGPIIYLGNNNTKTDISDIGFVGQYNNGSNLATGMIRDSGTKEYYLFKDYPEPIANGNIDITNPLFTKANINASYFKGNVIASTMNVNGLDVYGNLTSLAALSQAAFNVANTSIVNNNYSQGVGNTQNTNITATNTFAASAYGQANTSTTLAQASFNFANTAAANTVYTQGVDTTQNTNIAATNTYAASAYGQANTNATAINIIQGVDATQNTNITATNNYANTAYKQANTATTLAQAAFNYANNINAAVTFSKTTTANGATLTKSNLGLSAYDSNFFTANNGFISLNSQNIALNVAAPTNANSAVRYNDLAQIPANLLITALGSLDIQMTVGNAYASSVDQSGTPSYISSTSNMTLVGNATSLGTNYSVINSTYNLSGGNSNWGQVSFTIDISNACGLSATKFQADGVTINPLWKGNYNFSAFSALFKLYEVNFWDYAGGNQTFAYQINLIPVTNDYNNTNYGKYTVTADVYAARTYHNANLGARWMGLATKTRNLVSSFPTS